MRTGVNLSGSWPAILRRMRRPKKFCALSGSSDGVYGTDDVEEGVIALFEDGGVEDLTGDFLDSFPAPPIEG